MSYKFEVQNASWTRCIKNEDHYDFLWNLLSFTYVTRLPQYGGKIAWQKASYFNKKEGKFGTGLLPFICKKLDKKGEKYNLKYINKPIIPELKKNVKINGITFEEYQTKILDTLNTETRGIIKASTGSGKTYTTLGIIKKFNTPKTLILTPRENIARKTYSDLVKFGFNAGLICGNEKSAKPIIVAVWNSIKSLMEKGYDFNGYFGGGIVIIDEAHMAKEAISNILTSLPDVWLRFGLSATPIPKSEKANWFKVTSQLGLQIVQVSDEEAENRVTDVELFMFKNIKESVYKNYDDLYINELLLDPERNKLICKMTEFALKTRKNTIILLDEVRQARAIEKLMLKFDLPLPTLAHSGIGGDRIEKLIHKMNNEKIEILISTGVLGVGTDIPNVDSVIIASARKSKANVLQKIGRGRRRTSDKDTLLVLDIYDDFGDKYFWKYSEKRYKMYKRNGWFKGFK